MSQNDAIPDRSQPVLVAFPVDALKVLSIFKELGSVKETPKQGGLQCTSEADDTNRNICSEAKKVSNGVSPIQYSHFCFQQAC